MKKLVLFLFPVIFVCCTSKTEESVATTSDSEAVHVCILKNVPFEIINQRQEDVSTGKTVSFIFNNNSRLWYIIAPGQEVTPNVEEDEIQIKEELYQDFKVITKSRATEETYSIEAHKGGVSATIYALKAEDLNAARNFISTFIDIAEGDGNC